MTNLVSMQKGALRVVPLGGLGEIGMNCLVLETENDMIVIDCGVLFTDLEDFGIEFIIPNFKYLVERKDKLRAFVMTHGHEDHIGALPFALKAGLSAPVYASPFTSSMIWARLREAGLENRVDLRTFQPGDAGVFTAGDFKVRAVSVNHSIIEASALIIDTPVGRVVHTGDFRIDPSPYYGSAFDPREFEKAGDEGVLLLLSDSTNVERCEHGKSEKTLFESFENVFAQAKGMVVVSMFASNIGRMGQIFDLAAQTGRKVAVTGRSMEQNLRLAMEAGYLKGAQSRLVSLEHVEDVPRDELILLSTGSQGEFRAALARLSKGEHRQVHLREGDLVLISSRFIPGNEKSISRLINNLFRQGARVLYDAVHHVHVSGHASRPELEKMLRWTRPKYFVPIHGEYRHLVLHAELARETGVAAPCAVVASNGDVVEATPDRISIVDQFDDLGVLIDGPVRQEIPKTILKDRRKLAEAGAIGVFAVRKSGSGRLIATPQVKSFGVLDAEITPWLLEEAEQVVQKVLREEEKRLQRGEAPFDAAEAVRVELRRFFNERNGKKPVVLPAITDI